MGHVGGVRFEDRSLDDGLGPFYADDGKAVEGVVGQSPSNWPPGPRGSAGVVGSREPTSP
jgi:hypothetical protein